ncbi:hypothetical protein ACWGLE_18565 [Streptomyces sp. NPDC055897]
MEDAVSEDGQQDIGPRLAMQRSAWVWRLPSPIFLKGFVINRVYLSAIRNMWNDFCNSNAAPTRQQVLDHVTHVDDEVGQWFNPRVR